MSKSKIKRIDGVWGWHDPAEWQLYKWLLSLESHGGVISAQGKAVLIIPNWNKPSQSQILWEYI